MISVKIICLGKCKEQYLKDASAEYVKRLGTGYRFSLEELVPVRLPDNPNGTQISVALKAEAQMIKEKIPKGAVVVSLCIEGKMLTSEQLCLEMEKRAAAGEGSFAFIIGSSYGLDEEIKRLSDIRLSMSPMTFPHQLARIMLLEQLYRAYQIRLGTKYHK
ncbi:MAG: 23S rRNA (pseudouridine(1915)-N(3))-methyltransferase RlmH [Clostridia bacterium]|nr:23S rRNA (pseudouridine(1915)-N(3))-methyltransferase RlmH [Clostridia bacterium]